MLADRSRSAGVSRVSDVENAYWELYFAYRDLDAKIVARDRALETWRSVHSKFETGDEGGEAEKEHQSREQYFVFQAQVENVGLHARDALGETQTLRVGVEPPEARGGMIDGKYVRAEACELSRLAARCCTEIRGALAG